MLIKKVGAEEGGREGDIGEGKTRYHGLRFGKWANFAFFILTWVHKS